MVLCCCFCITVLLMCTCVLVCVSISLLCCKCKCVKCARHAEHVICIGYYTLAQYRILQERGVITCLSLLKPYSACTQHAVVQYYCILLKSPQGRSKPQSVLRAEASDTQVATQPLLFLKKTAKVPKRCLPLSLKKVALQMYQPKC